MVDFVVINEAPTTPGGIRFNDEIGTEYSREALKSATNFIWNLFQQTCYPSDRKTVEKVSLFIDANNNILTRNNEIHFGATYIGNYRGNVKIEFTGVLYHEMTRIWQWNGNGKAPLGLLHGIADFVRLRADYVPTNWVQPGQGDRWDQGNDVTARFLNYCDGLRNGFVAELNKMMRDGYDANYFVKLLGKDVNQLWSDYQAKYAT